MEDLCSKCTRRTTVERGKEVRRMLTMEGLIGLVSLVLTAFSLGYMIGHDNNKTQK